MKSDIKTILIEPFIDLDFNKLEKDNKKVIYSWYVSAKLNLSVKHWFKILKGKIIKVTFNFLFLTIKKII